MRTTLTAFSLVIALVPAAAAAREYATVTRLDAATVELSREESGPVAVWLSRDTRIDTGDKLVDPALKAAKLKLALPADTREFVILQLPDGSTRVTAERALPLAQASNFRDIGGYVTKDGHVVSWGKAFRSGAMPLLTDADYALIDQLHITTDVDLRSLDERQVWPDQIDDREKAMFVSNDYGMADLMKGFTAGNGENIYKGMEVHLAPQYRSLYRRIMADEGAVIYHCSAGQDRTGVATALLYDFLGVDRDTILKDYHLSTALRRTQWEMAPFDPAKYPGNPMAQYLAKGLEAPRAPEPLYTRSGASHLAQFFTYLDATYGGAEGYMKQVLGFSDDDLARLRSVMLR